MRRIIVGLSLLLGGVSLGGPTARAASDDGMHLPPEVIGSPTLLSTGESGRFAVIRGDGEALFRVDQLLNTVTQLPPMLAVNSDGWRGITADRRWIDFRTGATHAVPAAQEYLMSGDGSSYVGNLESGGAVLTLAGAAIPLGGRGRAVAISTDGTHVLLRGCPGPSCVDRFSRWSSVDPITRPVGSSTADIAPFIADDGRVVEQRLSGAPSRLIVHELDGGTVVFAHRQGDPVDTSPVGLVRALSGDGRFMVVFSRFTSCCASARIVEIETGHVQSVQRYGGMTEGGQGPIAISRRGSSILFTTGSIERDHEPLGIHPHLYTQINPLAPVVGHVPAGEVFAVQVAGAGGIAADASAAMLNVTVTNPSSSGHITVWPCGQPVPVASNGNFVGGQTVANAVLSSVGANGRVCVTSNSTIDVVVDAQGWFGPDAPYHPMTPARALDTRALGPAGAHTVADPSMLTVPIAGAFGVGSDASAAMVNVTVTEPFAAGHVTVWPCGEPRPNASNLNFAAGQTVANAVLVELGTAGQMCATSNTAAHVIVDVQGWFGVDAPYHAGSLARALDSRAGESDTVGNVGPAVVTELPVAGVGGVGVDASAVMLNVTVVNPETAGHVTIWPCGEAAPTASNGNFDGGQTVANAVLARVGGNGRVCAISNVRLDLVIDVQGWFGVGSPYHALTPVRLEDTRE